MTQSNNRRIAKNTLMLYFRMMLTMLVTLYTSRIILNTLGVEDYGIYNVVGGIVTMFAFFNSAMSSATQRFLSFEIGKGDFNKLRKIFNTIQIIQIGIAVLIFFLAETIGLWFVKNYLVIPNDRISAAIYVYHFSVISFMVSMIQVPYNSIIIAHEKMSVYAYVSIIEVSLKLLIVIILTWISYDKLILFGVLNLCVVILVTLIYRIYTQVNFKETKFELVREKQIFKTLVSYTGWSLFGNMAAVTKGQGINILLNIFFGPIVNAAIGIANQVQAAVSGFVFNFQIAVNPQIVKSYASGDKKYLNNLIISSSKYSFYLLFILSLPIILEVDQVLKLWLNNVPEYSSIFTILVLVNILIDFAGGSLIAAVQATGIIKLYQILIGSLLLSILPMSYIFLKLGYPPEITLYVTIAISLFVFSARLFMVWKLIRFPVLIFVKEVVLKNCFIIPLSLSIPLIIRNLFDESIMRLVIIIAASFTWNSIIIFFIGLNSNEKKIVKRELLKLKHKVLWSKTL